MRSSHLNKYKILFFIFSFSACTIIPQSIDSVGHESPETKSSLHSLKYSDIPQTMSSFSNGDDFNPFRSKINYPVLAGMGAAFLGDRKSTRLNSSHGYISYAVFCLKNTQQIGTTIDAGRPIAQGRDLATGQQER